MLWYEHGCAGSETVSILFEHTYTRTHAHTHIRISFIVQVVSLDKNSVSVGVLSGL